MSGDDNSDDSDYSPGKATSSRNLPSQQPRLTRSKAKLRRKLFPGEDDFADSLSQLFTEETLFQSACSASQIDPISIPPQTDSISVTPPTDSVAVKPDILEDNPLETPIEIKPEDLSEKSSEEYNQTADTEKDTVIYDENELKYKVLFKKQFLHQSTVYKRRSLDLDNPIPRKERYSSHENLSGFAQISFEDTEMTETFDSNGFHKSIPEFDGNIDNLNRFIACCDNFYNLITTDPVKKLFLSALVRKFTGRGFHFYNKVNEWASYEELKKSLKAYFSPTQSFEGYQIELSTLKQGKQSVREFGEKIERILVEINKISAEIRVNNSDGTQFFKVQNERLAIKSFLNGLNEPQKTILRSRKYTTIQDVIRDSIEIENEERLNKLQHLSISDEKPDNKESDKLTKPKISTQPNYSKTSNTSFRPICFKCNIAGHTANRCFKKNTFLRQFRLRPNPNNYFSTSNSNYNYDNNAKNDRFGSNGNNNRPNFNPIRNNNSNSNTASNSNPNLDSYGNNKNAYPYNSYNKNYTPPPRFLKQAQNERQNAQFQNKSRNSNSTIQALSKSKNPSPQSTSLDNVTLDLAIQ